MENIENGGSEESHHSPRSSHVLSDVHVGKVKLDVEVQHDESADQEVVVFVVVEVHEEVVLVSVDVFAAVWGDRGSLL